MLREYRSFDHILCTVQDYCKCFETHLHCPKERQKSYTCISVDTTDVCLCLQVHQQTHGSGIPASNFCETGNRHVGGGPPGTTERGAARSDGILQCQVVQQRFPASHVERPCRHDQDEQRRRGMAQSGEQSHRLLPSEHLQSGDGSEGGTGDYRAHTPTRRHWCATTSTTTEIPGP